MIQLHQQLLVLFQKFVQRLKLFYLVVMYIQIVQSVQVLFHTFFLIQYACRVHTHLSLLILIIPELILAKFVCQIFIVLCNITVHGMDQILVVAAKQHFLGIKGSEIQAGHKGITQGLIGSADQGSTFLRNIELCDFLGHGAEVFLHLSFVRCQEICGTIYECSVSSCLVHLCIIACRKAYRTGAVRCQILTHVLILQLILYQEFISFLLRRGLIIHGTEVLKQFRSQIGSNLGQRHLCNGSA